MPFEAGSMFSRAKFRETVREPESPDIFKTAPSGNSIFPTVTDVVISGLFAVTGIFNVSQAPGTIVDVVVGGVAFVSV